MLSRPHHDVCTVGRLSIHDHAPPRTGALFGTIQDRRRRPRASEIGLGRESVWSDELCVSIGYSKGGKE